MTTTYPRGPVALGTEFTYPELVPFQSGPHLVDRTTEGLLWPLERLTEMTADELTETIRTAAEDYATMALWRDLPRERQGDYSRLGWRYRDQRATASRVVWNAAKAERARRFGW